MELVFYMMTNLVLNIKVNYSKVKNMVKELNLILLARKCMKEVFLKVKDMAMELNLILLARKCIREILHMEKRLEVDMVF